MFLNKKQYEQNLTITSDLVMCLISVLFDLWSVKLVLNFSICLVDVNAVNTFGVTSLHIACQFGHISVVRFLVSVNASMETQVSFLSTWF